MGRIDEQYHDLLLDILKNGTERSDRTGTGTLAVFGRTLSYDMRNGFPLITTKKTWFKGILIELLWFLMGGTNLKYLIDHNVNIWNEWPFRDYIKENKISVLNGTKEWEEQILEFKNKIKNCPMFAEKWGNTGPIYGSQWTNFNGDGINQIKKIITTLNSNPDSRRMLVTALNPSKASKMTLEPCHYTFQIDTEIIPENERIKLFIEKTGKDKSFAAVSNLDNFKIPKRYISLLWNQRSVDVGLGLPFNIASYALLLEMISQQVNMIPLNLVGMFGNTHIYRNHIYKLKQQLERDAKRFASPDIKIQKAGSIFEYSPDDFKLIGYESFEKLTLPISV